MTSTKENFRATDGQRVAEQQALLLSSLALGPVVLANRVVVSPMSMYSAHDGLASDFHLVHLGRFALGGAGAVILEATAVNPHGRSTAGCLGIWSDAHVPGLRRIANFLHEHGSVPGIQIGHSGPKGSSQRPWHGMGPLGQVDATERGESPWPLVSSTDVPYGPGWGTPAEATQENLREIVEQFRMGARRARQAGFRIVELHCAHGYLLHSFLSPLVNNRTDDFGGSLQNRMRLPLQIVEAIQQELGDAVALVVRISSVDGVDVGWSLGDSVVFARELSKHGVHAVACSSGGIRLPKQHVLPARAPGFQVSFAHTIRHEAHIPTIAVGLIRDASQAESVLQQGSADLIALGREMLWNPNWLAQAAVELSGTEGWKYWPEQFGWWLERRDRMNRKNPS
jgi:2,4-dienoyl-CoA reductase-like NADH-dependent reductase (Old Yellow Enzyme family)